MTSNINFKDPHITPNQSVAIILSGQAESSPVDCSRGGLAGVVIPAGFPVVTVVFKVSADGTNFYDYRDSVTGNLLGITVSTANSLYRVLLSDTVAVSHIRIIAPAPVGADTNIQCLLRHTG